MLGEKSDRMYLSISYGQIRKRCNPDTPGAIERQTKDGEKTYAIEYRYVSGTLEGVTFRDDPKYGASWLILIVDGKDKYGISISEESRYASDLLKRIPNLVKGQGYRFTPYDFETDGKRRKGLSIKDQADQPVPSYYQEYNEADNTWSNLHGFPVFDGNSKDKDDWKIYFIKVNKFLRESALEYLEDNFKDEIIEPDSGKDMPPEDNLPF